MQLVLTKVGSESNISALSARTSGVSGWAGRHLAGLKAHCLTLPYVQPLEQGLKSCTYGWLGSAL